MNSICLNVGADLSLAARISAKVHNEISPLQHGYSNLVRLKPLCTEFRLIDMPESTYDYKGFFISADNRVYRERAEKFRLEMQETGNGVDILGAALNALAVVSIGAQRNVQASDAGSYKLVSSVLDNKGNRVVYSHRNPEYCNLYLWTLNGSWQARLNHKIAENELCIISANGNEATNFDVQKLQSPLTWARGSFNLKLHSSISVQ